MRSIEPYVEGWRARIARETERTERVLGEIRPRLMDAVRLLVEHYGVTKAVVFGSLASGRFRPGRSDVDLAVAGLASSSYHRAWAEVVDSLGDEAFLDLVRIEEAGPRLRWAIEHGQVLHG